MFFSNVTIIFNKYLLDTAGFRTFTSLCVVQVAPILGFLALHVMGNLTADEFEEQQIIASPIKSHPSARNSVLAFGPFRICGLTDIDFLP